MANKCKVSLIALLADILALPFEVKKWVLKQNVDKHAELTKAKEDEEEITKAKEEINKAQEEEEEEITHVLSDQYTDVMVNPLGTVTAYRINDSSGTLYIIGTTAQTLKKLGVVFETEEVLVVELFPVQLQLPIVQ